MTPSPFKTLLAPLLVAAIATVFSTHARSQPLDEGASRDAVVTADRILDVRNGRMIRNGHVLVRDGRIVEVGPGNSTDAAGAGIRRIALGDMTLLPGLIDMHVHLDSDPDLRRLHRSAVRRPLLVDDRRAQCRAHAERRLHDRAQCRRRCLERRRPAPGHRGRQAARPARRHRRVRVRRHRRALRLDLLPALDGAGKPVQRRQSGSGTQGGARRCASTAPR